MKEKGFDTLDQYFRKTEEDMHFTHLTLSASQRLLFIDCFIFLCGTCFPLPYMYVFTCNFIKNYVVQLRGLSTQVFRLMTSGFKST